MVLGLLETCAETDEDPLFLANIKTKLKREVIAKFSLEAIDVQSGEVLVLDPRFKSLTFLTEEERSDVYDELGRHLKAG